LLNVKLRVVTADVVATGTFPKLTEGKRTSAVAKDGIRNTAKGKAHGSLGNEGMRHPIISNTVCAKECRRKTLPARLDVRRRKDYC
jgi:hypothetical protein